MADNEIAAMSTLADALDRLDEQSRRRVINWAAARYLDAPPPGPQFDQGNSSEFSEFVDLFHATSPASAADKALVAAYWFQQIQGNVSLRAQDINGALADLGHRLGNITDALRTLEERKPAHIRQTGKAGRSRQARKSYKLTTEGVSRVEGLLTSKREQGNADG